MEAFTAVIFLTTDIDRDLKSRFQSGSRPTLNSFSLWSLPPYSPNFIRIRQVLCEKHWSGSQIFKIRPLVFEKHWSGSPIVISIRITPNFELGLPMIITSLLIKIDRNPTSSLWEILLTNKKKQTNKQTNRKTNKQTQEGDCNIPLFAGWKYILYFIGWSLRNWKIAAFLQLAKNWNTPNNLWQFFFFFNIPNLLRCNAKGNWKSRVCSWSKLWKLWFVKNQRYKKLVNLWRFIWRDLQFKSIRWHCNCWKTSLIEYFSHWEQLVSSEQPWPRRWALDHAQGSFQISPWCDAIQYA